MLKWIFFVLFFSLFSWRIDIANLAIIGDNATPDSRYFMNTPKHITIKKSLILGKKEKRNISNVRKAIWCITYLKGYFKFPIYELKRWTAASKYASSNFSSARYLSMPPTR